ncbi:MAG: redoxin domain-containing protein [Myxococcales bacterium]|nr:redoxin domain-containing protein [Myxococcales bacterium]
MIKPGTEAPDFALNDHFGRTIALADLRGRKHAMLVFYPLDFTPT